MNITMIPGLKFFHSSLSTELPYLIVGVPSDPFGPPLCVPAPNPPQPSAYVFF